MPWKHNREEAWQRLPWKQERQEIRESEGCTSWKQESATSLESAFVKLVEEERKKAVEQDATLQADLESLLDPKGDPMSLVRWDDQVAFHSWSRHWKALGHQIKKSALAELRARSGLLLTCQEKRNIEGVSHPDRDAQCASHQRAMPGV